MTTPEEADHDDLARFEALLDVYGADPRRWPAARRGWGEALLARLPAARMAQAEAGRLDALLDTAGLDPAPAHLVGRVLAAAPSARSAAAAPRGWILSAWLKPVLGLAFAAVLGLALGGIVSPFAPAGTEFGEGEMIALDLGVIPEIEL